MNSMLNTAPITLPSDVRRPVPALLRAMVLGVTGLALMPSVRAEVPVTVTPPNLDRWMYPFNSQPSNRPTASSFTTLGFTTTDKFDDRDAQYALGFATSSVAAPGAPASSYRVRAVSVRAMVNVPENEFGQPMGFLYDPTFDPLCTYTGSCADADPGRPLELFAAGYRGERLGVAWGPLTFTQSSPFASQAPINPPAQGNRNLFAADFGPDAAWRDASNNVSGTPLSPEVYGPAFEVSPLAIGIARGVYPPGADLAAPAPLPPPSPGSMVQDRTDFEFVIDLNAPGARAYVQEGLSLGQLNFVIATLHPAPNLGLGDVTYPIFYTRFNPFGVAARLLVELEPDCHADIAGTDASPGADGQIDNGDFLLFIASFFGADCDGAVPCNPADIAGTDASPGADGQVDNGDFLLFIAGFFGGC
jgi:hypothetical protein